MILIIDDTGSRVPERKPIDQVRADKMDCFGLGGILVKEEDIPEIVKKHKDFCDKWSLKYPLHSSRIRGGRGNFGWLKKPENSVLFMPDLQKLILSLDIVCISCVINRPGYMKRYIGKYEGRIWLMCKTAFTILVERASKFADDNKRNLSICFEESGKKEDRDIINYMRELKKTGNPFNTNTSKAYDPLTASDYSRIVLGEPRRKTKKNPLIQIADLILYPLAKAAYETSYPPFQKLKEHEKLINCLLCKDEIPEKGNKYSCFDEI